MSDTEALTGKPSDNVMGIGNSTISPGQESEADPNSPTELRAFSSEVLRETQASHASIVHQHSESVTFSHSF